MPDPLLIPQPASIVEGRSDDGPFALAAGISIVVSHEHEPGEWVAAQHVKLALHAHGIEAPVQPQILSPDPRKTIVLAVRGRDDAVFADAADLGIAAPAGDSAEAYTLAVCERWIAVWGVSPAGLARGAQTVCQLLAGAGGEVPALRIADAPVLPWRGVMLDVSRGKIPTLDTLKHVVDVIASFKINVLQLYTEHAFAARRHPRIGEVWGALSPEELVTLDRYCRERYVELIPCLQSFGHLRRMLELPEYARLTESGERWSLAPAREETYALLDDLYADYLACFSSRSINVCSDETYDLGTGQSKAEAERVGLGRVYLGHILRLHQLARKYGRTMMVWDDIFLHHPELINDIPGDTIMLNWAYEAQDDYPQVTGFHEAGLQQIVCPGTSSWNTLFPRLANARANIRNFVRAGLRVGATGVLTTDWGDGGHPNPLGASWYGYAYGGAEGWTPGLLADEAFDERFTTLFFGAAEGGTVREAMSALTMACTLPSVFRNNGSLSIELFADDPLEQKDCAAIPDATLAAMRDMAAHARALLTRVHGTASTAGRDEATRTITEFRLAANLVHFAARRAEAARQVARVEGTEAARALDVTLSGLKRELHALRLEYQWVWLARNKPEGLWITLDMFDRSARAIDRWREAVAPAYAWD